ncbi:MAG: thiamine pyrophosphate-dependent enzyme [Candidatus Lokiarchaeota archaeon]
MKLEDDLGTYAENTWCKGCGNFGILKSIQKTIEKLEEEGYKRENFAISAGIGCHGKIWDYLRLNGLYSLHGRPTATVQGMQIANPDLKVIAFSGDGDAMGEGISHTLFAAKRNTDMTLVLHNNQVYALTTGQFTPTSKRGYKGPSTPEGSPEDPINPLTLILEANATFVARVFPGKMDHMVETLAKAVKHEGFSFVEVLQPAVAYNNTWKYNKNTVIIEDNNDDYEKAMKLAKQTDKLPIGVFYQTKSKLPFHKALHGDHHPISHRMSRQNRLENVKKLLETL